MGNDCAKCHTPLLTLGDGQRVWANVSAGRVHPVCPDPASDDDTPDPAAKGLPVAQDTGD
jgi:hypothetical protein